MKKKFLKYMWDKHPHISLILGLPFVWFPTKEQIKWLKEFSKKHPSLCEEINKKVK